MTHLWLEEMEGDLAEQYFKIIRGGCPEWERLPYGGTFDWERDSDLSDFDDESTYDDESDQNSDEESSMDSVEEEEDTSLGIGEAFTIAVDAT
jgi:hypothetical protein